MEADSLEAVEVLMRRPEVRDQPDLRGRTALMWAAAAAGACDMIKAMCRHGSDLGHQVGIHADIGRLIDSKIKMNRGLNPMLRHRVKLTCVCMSIRLFKSDSTSFKTH